MAKKAHSNVFYIRERDGTYTPRKNARGIRNDFGADLFRFKNTIYEGQTGIIVCGDERLQDFLSSDKGKFAEALQFAIDKHGLSPRYTQPEVTKDQLFPPDDRRKLARALYQKGKSYFTRLDTLENGLELYLQDKDKDLKNLYAWCDGWMIGLDSLNRKDLVYEKLNAPGFDLRQFMLDGFEASLADPKKWADPGVAEFFDRREEADAHNRPIREAREAENQRKQVERVEKALARERELEDAYQKAIASAERGILNYGRVNETLINGQSLLLQLFRENNIDVPLRTQGWIKKSLCTIQYEPDTDSISYSYSGRASTVICKYYRQLVEAVQAKYQAVETQSPQQPEPENGLDDDEWEAE